MKPNRVDVLVAGAGPVGLATALFAAEQGRKVMVVDAKPRGVTHSYALALHLAALEMLDGVDRGHHGPGLAGANPGDVRRGATHRVDSSRAPGGQVSFRRGGRPGCAGVGARARAGAARGPHRMEPSPGSLYVGDGFRGDRSG